MKKKSDIKNFKEQIQKIEQGKSSELSLINVDDFDSLVNTGLFGKKIHSIKKLSIQFCKLESFPLFIKNLKGLEYLDLSNNAIANIPDWISGLPNLRSLVLVENKFSALPSAIINLKVLEGVYLSFNPYLEINDAIKKLAFLPGLKSLCISFKDGIPDSLYQLTHLEKLSILSSASKNLAPLCLSARISNLTGLTELECFNIGLNKLPDSICDLKNLKYLNIAGNEIKELPENFASLQSLEVLNLKNNPIAEEPANGFEEKNVADGIYYGPIMENENIRKLQEEMPKLNILF